MSPLLSVENLHTEFQSELGNISAVNGVSYDLEENEIVGIVGESGCGKTVSQLSVMQLISNPGQIAGGRILFDGSNLLEFLPRGKEMCAIRGSKIAMIFQEPTSCLNPVRTVGWQIVEMLQRHLGLGPRSARERAIDLLASVKIPDASKRFGDYPYQFSGGMLQRAMIAMALSCVPRILIADEPTSALDVTTQVQVLDLMRNLVSNFRTSMLLVTHSFGIVARYTQRLYVMYAGQILESGSTEEVLHHPLHPYTRTLLESIPMIHNGNRGCSSGFSRYSHDLTSFPGSCSFIHNCGQREKSCLARPAPSLARVNDQHYVRCYGEL